MNIDDQIIYLSIVWSYKHKKSIATKEKAKIIEICEYDDKNWGTKNIRIIPEKEILRDKKGGLWISEFDIIK